jgi:hypothetical protein
MSEALKPFRMNALSQHSLLMAPPSPAVPPCLKSLALVPRAAEFSSSFLETP